MDEMKRGAPVRDMANIGAWVRSRRVRLGVRWLKSKREWEVRATSGTHRIRTLNADITIAMGVTVDTMNDMLKMRGED